jgi:hypothetical protein
MVHIVFTYIDNMVVDDDIRRFSLSGELRRIEVDRPKQKKSEESCLVRTYFSIVLGKYKVTFSPKNWT